MRSREEVLAEFGLAGSEPGLASYYPGVFKLADRILADDAEKQQLRDRIRELESQQAASEAPSSPGISDAQPVAWERFIELATALKTEADSAYSDMLREARKTPSLGWEAKVKRGEFGRVELDAHVSGGRLHGKHQAYHDAAQRIKNVLGTIPHPSVSPQSGDRGPVDLATAKQSDSEAVAAAGAELVELDEWRVVRANGELTGNWWPMVLRTAEEVAREMDEYRPADAPHRVMRVCLREEPAASEVRG